MGPGIFFKCSPEVTCSHIFHNTGQVIKNSAFWRVFWIFIWLRLTKSYRKTPIGKPDRVSASLKTIWKWALRVQEIVLQVVLERKVTEILL